MTGICAIAHANKFMHKYSLFIPKLVPLTLRIHYTHKSNAATVNFIESVSTTAFQLNTTTLMFYYSKAIHKSSVVVALLLINLPRI